ncbi:MAG: hypothetical protein LBC48_00195 [Dysgonamonadaceae bacterium]|jgi:hypothetical protein|nr:hypothetical protein [Dysgonamonadaceae bacterium]
MISINKYFLKRKINNIFNSSNREKEYHNLKEIKTVLLLLDTKDYSDASFFIKQLKKLGKKVRVCAYKDKRDKNNYSNILNNIIAENDTNVWKNDFMTGIINSLGSESYDLAINLTLKENLFLQYVLVSIDSRFKVGFSKTDLPIYDMVISFAPQMESDEIITAGELSKQLMHYLSTISSGNFKNKKN